MSNIYLFVACSFIGQIITSNIPNIDENTDYILLLLACKPPALG